MKANCSVEKDRSGEISSQVRDDPPQLGVTSADCDDNDKGGWKDSPYIHMPEPEGHSYPVASPPAILDAVESSAI